MHPDEANLSPDMNRSDCILAALIGSVVGCGRPILLHAAKRVAAQSSLSSPNHSEAFFSGIVNPSAR